VSQRFGVQSPFQAASKIQHVWSTEPNQSVYTFRRTFQQGTSG
jgi:hypothetical protein